MPGKNHYTLYKGYKLYYPMGHDLLKDCDGRYAVYVVFSSPYSNVVERVVVPGCFVDTLREAEKLSLAHARRMIDERSQAGPAAPARALRGMEGHAGNP